MTSKLSRFRASHPPLRRPGFNERVLDGRPLPFEPQRCHYCIWYCGRVGQGTGLVLALPNRHICSMRGKNRIYTEELLREAAKTSESISEVCRKVGIDRPGGGSYELVKNRLKELEIDTSHFLGYRVLAGKRGVAFKNRQKPEEVLISNVGVFLTNGRKVSVLN